jgi:hypothetical protein
MWFSYVRVHPFRLLNDLNCLMQFLLRPLQRRRAHGRFGEHSLNPHISEQRFSASRTTDARGPLGRRNLKCANSLAQSPGGRGYVHQREPREAAASVKPFQAVR